MILINIECHASKLQLKHEGTQCKSTQTFFSSSVTEEELLMFDLQSLATLATARALEMDSQEGCSAGLGRHFPTRRIFNLRRNAAGRLETNQ